MNEYLKHYRVKIHALSPIHVGSGEKIGKKEYIYMPWNHRVIIPNVEKMYMNLQKKGLEKEFINFMLDSRVKGPSLSQWMRQHDFRGEDYEKWKIYEMDAGEAFLAKPQERPKEIASCIKDAYGLPYIPGSSVKGMFRTAIIAWEIHKKPDKYRNIKGEIEKNSALRSNRKQCLAKEMTRLEQQILYTLDRDEKKAGNAVNDNLSGLHVGDSEPISLDQLTLCQKIDYTLEGAEKPLPLLRETLIPGTEICMEVSIDQTVCPYQMEDIIEALDYFQNVCYKYFYSRFKRGTKERHVVWLGGGCGFLSKTILYPLFGVDAVKIVDNVFKNTLSKSYSLHKHTRDCSLQLAPHVCKCTRYQGKLYDMGMGYIEFEEI